jgi:hypothetical protein
LSKENTDSSVVAVLRALAQSAHRSNSKAVANPAQVVREEKLALRPSSSRMFDQLFSWHRIIASCMYGTIG